MASRAALGNPAVAVARKRFTVLLITDGTSPRCCARFGTASFGDPFSYIAAARSHFDGDLPLLFASATDAYSSSEMKSKRRRGRT